MAELAMFDPLFTAIKQRFVERRVLAKLPGGAHLFDVPERQLRPFAILVPRAEREFRFTNKHKYGTLVFAVEMYADTFAELDGVLIREVTGALQHADFGTLPNGLTVQSIRPGDVEYEKAEQIWSGIPEFLAQVAQPAVGTANP